jgi:CRISPR-associated endonuclease/helicase Cas3
VSTPTIQFGTAFSALTDHSPLAWQCRLFEQLRSREIPCACDLPTGLGKTSVIPIWTIALAEQTESGSITLPRRLVYVVNRRTVVDQATSVVEQIRQRLLAPDDAGWSKHSAALRSLAGALQKLASTEELLLAVSTLRGELADNEEWKADPAGAAIMIGTIDMIGSKLLFSGYGDGRYSRAHHAGLIGQDSLIVHDEAHLTPAFSELLHQLTAVQCQACEPRPLKVMDLSATSRGGAGPTLRLEAGDEEDQVVKDRLDATKRLYVHEVQARPGEKRADVAKRALGKMVDLSLEHRDARAKVLIYVRSPERAQEVLRLLRRELEKGHGQERTALLTGTIRGHERDELVKTNRVYRAFLDPEAQVDESVYLVSTSAGEVGIDLDADHMICDLTTLDSMIQRLGRVNRRGGQGREARVDVVVQTGGEVPKDSPSEVEVAISATRTILNDWALKSDGGIDASPRALRAFLDTLDGESRENAFAPRPAVPPLTEILLDAWSLTSITEQLPGRPEVASYLHGLEKSPPETFVVWRKELALLHGANASENTLSDWFQACRIKAAERLRDRTDRVKKTLEALLGEHRKKDEARDFSVVVLNERGQARSAGLSSIVDDQFNLRYRTVVLPVEAGGLNRQGALDAKATEAARDVAEERTQEGKGERRERWLHIEDTEGPRYERLSGEGPVVSLPQDLSERERVTLKEAPEGRGEEGGSRYLLLMAEPRQSTLEHPEAAQVEQTLTAHGERIACMMGRIGDKLGLDNPLMEALVLAAKPHDCGKNRPVWQRYACNAGTEPVAKSRKYLHGRALGGYRHEFGSLLEAAEDGETRRHAEADLILHLIAAHHGWARPHFERNAADNTRSTSVNEEATAEAMRRFGRLQQRFGRWGLAWLESLLRCADIAASKPDARSLAGDSTGESSA